MRNRLAAVSVFLTLIFLAGSAYAQLGFAENLTLSVTPQYAAPGETVRVSAESLLLDLEAGNLTWYVNGVQRASGPGLLQIDVTAGSNGSETQVRVVFMQEGIEVASSEVFIRPTELDLIWESDSYTPPFFHGRALPSAGTNLHMEVRPRFKRADGSFVSPRDIIFTWRRNGYVIASASGRGKSQATISSPPLFGTDVISVEARTLDGLLSGETSVRIPSTEPILALYENHPIFGILYHRALGAQSTLPEVETSFAAVPYFAEASAPNDVGLIWEWHVDGNAITNDPAQPNEITINAEGSTGLARIELELLHATNLFLSASGSWGITLLPGAGTPGNPFGATQ
ncbi:hypothetical protein A2853_04295 [Candidatus Kaiserbacteria bacterium RIFCSPHIGHO2_01_FULL_55_17]|uniref:Uncharacterized protein n=1 Tax=Candidatus Kaiserbacteria bacterium RIFCSPHIGHO2_01_FULL_55_17 TaxID=1798484 RepID=A0A1F6D8I2_9BACT|nr:MAG: hypothetical protein A2853_04295 [Candidatus Kaiserbacteria bacterium RIFCSPHIGHO2_01_FULL_55_17]